MNPRATFDFLYALAECARARGALLWPQEKHRAMREFATADSYAHRAFALAGRANLDLGQAPF